MHKELEYVSHHAFLSSSEPIILELSTYLEVYAEICDSFHPSQTLSKRQKTEKCGNR